MSGGIFLWDSVLYFVQESHAALVRRVVLAPKTNHFLSSGRARLQHNSGLFNLLLCVL